MQRQPHAGALGHRDDARQEVLEGVPELLGRHLAGPSAGRRARGEPEAVTARHRGRPRDGRARPVDAGIQL